jgi:tetratricopeptide (TPR) repeat protein
MTRENLAFLIGGLAFGVLLGAGLLNAIEQAPQLDIPATTSDSMPAPAGPRAPNQVGPGGAEGGAPMMAEINTLKQRLQEDGNSLAVLRRLGDIYYEAAMWEKAAGYYERALVVEPDSPNLMTDLGVCYRGQQQFDRAMELFVRAQSADASHWESLFNMAVVAGFDLGQFDRAMAAIEAMDALAEPVPRLAELRAALEQAREAAGTQDGS